MEIQRYRYRLYTGAPACDVLTFKFLSQVASRSPILFFLLHIAHHIAHPCRRAQVTALARIRRRRRNDCFRFLVPTTRHPGCIASSSFLRYFSTLLFDLPVVCAPRGNRGGVFRQL